MLQLYFYKIDTLLDMLLTKSHNELFLAQNKLMFLLLMDKLAPTF